jgi:hypothetical protein
MPTKTSRFLLLTAAGTALITLACGFAFIKNTDTGLPLKWAPGTIPMKVMVDNTTVLSDGNTRATAVQATLQDSTRGWNHNLGDAQFAPTILAVGSGTDGNNLNEVFFAGSPYSGNWDTNTLAITTAWYVGNERVEGDTIFNTNFTWDSYRGTLHAGSEAGKEDLERVALHEFGHTLGLDHPDDAGQTVSAVMNSHVSNVDSLQADDIQGGQSLYGPPGVPVNDNFASAIVISGATATVTGYNTNATKETGEPNHAGNIGGRSIWWKWTAPQSGVATIDTRGSLCDTTLGIYLGTTLSTLATVASNDDVQDGVIQYSSVTFNASSGVTYYIAVDGFNGNDGHGADSAFINVNVSVVTSATTSTTSTSSSVTSTSSSVSTTSISTTSTIPPTNSGGGGGGGGAPSTWFLGALSLLACARRMFPKKG